MRQLKCYTVLLAGLAAGPLHAQTDPGSTSRGAPVRITQDSAAGRVVDKVYEKRDAYVRIETREPGAPLNDHPAPFAPVALRAALEQVQIAGGKKKPEPLFSAKQLDEIAAPLATALGRATPEQDVSFAVSDQKGFLGPLAPRAVTTARVFRREGQLQLIVGLAQRDFESQFRATGVLIAFEPGQRAAPVEPGVRLAVAPGSGSVKRGDWLQLNPTAVAARTMPAADAGTGSTTPVPAVAPSGGGLTPTSPSAMPAPAAPAVAPALAPAPAAPAAPDADAIYRNASERLKALQKLRDSGVITEPEYQEKRRQILRDL